MNTLVNLAVDTLAQAALRNMLIDEDGPGNVFKRFRESVGLVWKDKQGPFGSVGYVLEETAPDGSLRQNIASAVTCPICFPLYAVPLFAMLRKLGAESIVSALAVSWLALWLDSEGYGLGILVDRMRAGMRS